MIPTLPAPESDAPQARSGPMGAFFGEILKAAIPSAAILALVGNWLEDPIVQRIAATVLGVLLGLGIIFLLAFRVTLNPQIKPRTWLKAVARSFAADDRAGR